MIKIKFYAMPAIIATCRLRQTQICPKKVPMADVFTALGRTFYAAITKSYRVTGSRLCVDTISWLQTEAKEVPEQVHHRERGRL